MEQGYLDPTSEVKFDAPPSSVKLREIAKPRDSFKNSLEPQESCGVILSPILPIFTKIKNSLELRPMRESAVMWKLPTPHSLIAVL
jgi:hypothetical protein